MLGRSWCRKWVSLALLPGLVGCADFDQAFNAPEQTPITATAKPAPQPDEDTHVASVPPAPRPPTRPQTPREPPIDPQTLKGIDQEQALGLFGRPSEITEAAPATVWRYRDKKCQLDLFFYMDLGTHSFHVLTYEFRPGERSVSGQRACLNRLREASRAH